MRKFLAILGVTALAFAVPVGAGSVGAQDDVTPAESGTFCVGVVNTLGAFGQLAGVLNLAGFGAFAEGGFADPTQWPEGFTNPPAPFGTAADVPQATLDTLIGAIVTNWTLANDNKGDVPGDVEGAFQTIFDAFDAVNPATTFSVQTALTTIVAQTWLTIAGTPTGAPPAPPLSVPVAGTIAGGLAALGGDLEAAVATLVGYIEDTGCVTPAPDPVEPGDDVPAFCVVLFAAVNADYAGQLRAILTDASVDDPSVVDNAELKELVEGAYETVLAGNATVPPDQAENWQAATGSLVDIYALLQSYEFDWALVLQPVRAAVVASLNSDEPDPDGDAVTEALTDWVLTNCGDTPPGPGPGPGPGPEPSPATPKFTG